tara:strand:+ start:347 stop:1333 length:987 start_codon:yes stop_codon:yes gene_type:complete
MTEIAKIRRFANELVDATTSTEKLIILQNHSTDSLIKLLVTFAYDPMIQFDMKEWTPIKTGKPHGMGLPVFMHLFEEILNNKHTLAESIFACNLAVTHMNEEEVPIFVAVMKNECDWGLDVDIINNVWHNLIREYPIQYASEYTEENIKNISFPCVVQQRMNGVRVNVIVRGEVAEFKNALGESIHKLDVYADQFKILAQNGAIVFDGCAVVVDDKMNIVGTTLDDIMSADVSHIRLMLWDTVRYDGFVQYEDTRIGYNWRYNGIEHMMLLAADKNKDPCYSMVRSEVVSDMTGVTKFIESNDCDVIIKDFAGTWRDGITPFEVIIRK